MQGDAVSGQGLYVVPARTAVINEAIGAAHATLPRIDMVVLEALDDLHDASGSNLTRVRVIAGTATSGATLDNRTGAASLPDSCLLLADVLIAGGASSITNAVIRNRRRWARGAFVAVSGTGGGDHSNATATPMELTAYTSRIECSGAPVRLTLTGRFYNMTSRAAVRAAVRMDDSALGNGSLIETAPTSDAEVFCLDVVTTPAAGSHKFQVFLWRVSSGTAKLDNNNTNQPHFTIQELVRQNTANNTTTTG